MLSHVKKKTEKHSAPMLSKIESDYNIYKARMLSKMSSKSVSKSMAKSVSKRDENQSFSSESNR